MSGIDYLASIYKTLRDNAKQEYVDNSLTIYPRSSKEILRFLSGYANHTYHVHKGDFTDIEGASEAAIRQRPEECDVFSFVQIHDRPKDSTSAYRRIDIFINTAESKEHGRIVNYCWSRFCRVKEACQAIVFEDYLDKSHAYPYSQSFTEVEALFLKINTEPYSLWDFDNEEYDEKNFVENVAELLALGLLVGFEKLLDLKQELEAKFESSISKVDLSALSNDLKIPKRYLELMLTWSKLDDLVDSIEQS